MNKREKEVIQNQLNNEKEVLRKIKGVYEDALTGIDDKIKLLMSDELTQSKIYQIEYQKALKGQISAILDSMNTQQYEKVSDYLQNCYEDGFIGTMYNLQGQGVPLVIPIDQEQIVQVIQKDTKLSKPLYKKLGQNTEELKGVINSEISRGIASGYSYADIARNITNATVSVGINRTMTIARTEGHRVNQEASYHAQIKAKERGADVVKQWDSTLDKRTRKSHAKLDGQIREVEEPFEINGYKAMHPCNFGVAKEDINCRCAVLQRAMWGITDEEFTKMNGETGELVRMKERDYQSFKESYKEKAKEVKPKPEPKSEPKTVEPGIVKDYDFKKNLSEVDSMSEQWEKSLSKNEFDSISNYTTGNYEDMNNFLRGNKSKISKSKQTDIENVQKSLRSYETKEAMVVHRGVSADALGSVLDEDTIKKIDGALVTDPTTAKELNKALSGVTYTDKGFMSTSWDKNASFAGRFQFDITVPKGYKNGAFVHNMSAFKKESEFLLNSGTSLQIDSVVRKGKKYIIKATVI